MLESGAVIDQYDLTDQLLGGSVEDRVDRPQESGPGLVVEGDDDWRPDVRYH